MSTAPIEFPPPVDSGKEFVGPPVDPEDERIEVGVAIVGGGPAGLACAIRLTQLLAEDETPARVARRGAGRAGREGQGPGLAPAVGGDDEAVGDAEAVPGPARGGLAHLRAGAEGHGLPAAQPQAGDPAEADAAAVPQPRQPRHLGRAAGPLAGAAGRGRGRVHPRRDRRGQAARRRRARGRRPLGRQGPRPRRRGAVELRARRGPDRQGHGALRGDPGPPDRRGDPPLRARLGGPAAVGARASRRSGRSSSRSTASSTRWAGRCASRPSTASSAARSSTRWARTRSRWAWSSASTTATPASRCTTRSRSSRATRSSRSCSRAASASAGAPRRCRRAATGRGRAGCGRPAWRSAATARAWSTCRRSRASTTPCTPGCSPPRRSTSG